MNPCPVYKNNDIELTGEGFNAQIKCIACEYIRGGFSKK